MPCRRPPAASPCLWITDDVLSDAFERFLRVSNAQRYHGKRFWSNAPGPLEARRRATRRRMGLESVGNSSGPPPFDMGALFGLGVKPGADMEKGMRWERPQLPDARSKPQFLWDFTSKQQRSRRRERDDRIASFLEIPEDPVQRSKAGFEALLPAIPRNQALERSDIQSVLEYIVSNDNEPEARLTRTLLGWILDRSASGDCLSAFTDVVKQKLALGTILELETQVILRMLYDHTKHESFVAIAESVPQSWAHRILLDITQQVLDSPKGTQESRLKHLHRWLTCLRACTKVPGFQHSLADGWDAVYAAISQTYMPSDLGEHFSNYPNMDTALVLLQHWAPRLARELLDRPPTSADGRDARRLRFNEAVVSPSDLPDLIAELKELQASARTVPTSHRKPLVYLFQVLAERRVPYQTLLAEVVTIYTRTETASALRNFLKTLVRQPSIDIAPVLATSIVQAFMTSEDLNYALQIFEAVPSIPLSAIYSLPTQLIEKQKMHGERTFIMLNRLVPQDIVPAEERTTHKLLLTPQHCDTVHLVAYAYAASPHIGSRVALRRVWECYRFLKDRSAPLDPLISRALVKAGITRPLSEGKRPSADQTRYIIKLVQQLEGEDVARRLDMLVFNVGQRIARGLEAIPNHKHHQGTQHKRDLQDQRMVRAAQNRLKTWRSKGWAKKEFRAFKRFRPHGPGTRRLPIDQPAETALEVVESAQPGFESLRHAQVHGNGDTSPATFVPLATKGIDLAQPLGERHTPQQEAVADGPETWSTLKSATRPDQWDQAMNNASPADAVSHISLSFAESNHQSTPAPAPTDLSLFPLPDLEAAPPSKRDVTTCPTHDVPITRSANPQEILHPLSDATVSSISTTAPSHPEQETPLPFMSFPTSARPSYPGRHEKYLKRRQFLVNEQKAAKRNAEGWAAFAERERMKRRRKRYATRRKEACGEKEDGEVEGT